MEENSGLKAILGWIFGNWVKLFIFTPLMTLLMIFLLFPFSDLKDLVTGLVADATQNSVFLTYDDAGLSVGSGLGIKVEGVQVEVSSFPPIKLDSASFAPSMAAIFSQTPAGSLNLSGLFRGQFSGSIDSTKKNNDQFFNIETSGDKIQLKSLVGYLKKARLVQASFLPPSVVGSLNFDMQATVDPTSNVQPVGQLRSTIEKLKTDGFTLAIKQPGGFSVDLDIPALKFSKVNIIAKMENREIQVAEVRLGDGKDGLKIAIDGTLVAGVDGGRGFSTGAFDFNFNMEFLNSALTNPDIKSFYDYVDLALSKCKRQSSNGVRYNFKLKASRIGAPALPRCL